MVGAAEQARARRGCVRRQFYRNERKRPRERFRRERLRRHDPARGAAAREQASRGASGSFGREVRVGDARQDEAGRPVEPAGNHPILPDNSPEQGGFVELGRGGRPRGTVSQVAPGPRRRPRRASRVRRSIGRLAEGGSAPGDHRVAHAGRLLGQLALESVAEDQTPSSSSVARRHRRNRASRRVRPAGRRRVRQVRRHRGGREGDHRARGGDARAGVRRASRARRAAAALQRAAREPRRGLRGCRCSRP